MNGRTTTAFRPWIRAVSVIVQRVRTFVRGQLVVDPVFPPTFRRNQKVSRPRRPTRSEIPRSSTRRASTGFVTDPAPSAPNRGLPTVRSDLLGRHRVGSPRRYSWEHVTEAGDDLVVAGSDESSSRFRTAFARPVARRPPWTAARGAWVDSRWREQSRPGHPPGTGRGEGIGGGVPAHDGGVGATRRTAYRPTPTVNPRGAGTRFPPPSRSTGIAVESFEERHF